MGLDYYVILDIPRNSTLEQINLAYRKWAIASHPQRKPYPQHPENPPEGVPNTLPLPSLPTSTYWKLVNEAYDVLSSSLYRQMYDVYGEEGLKIGVPAPNGFIQPYVYHNDYMKTYESVLGTFTPYADLIDAVVDPPPLYMNANGTGVKEKDPDIEKLLYLDLEEIFHGGLKKIKILRDEFVDENKIQTKIREKILVIPFAPGILTGTRFKFVEHGDQHHTRIPADLILIVVDRRHNIFKRNGSNLEMTHTITLKQAFGGFHIDINMLDGRKLRVPITKFINPSYKKIIKGEGLPFPNDSKERGDLIINFEIEYPKCISNQIKQKLVQDFEEM